MAPSTKKTAITSKATVKYNPKTGAKLKSGESVTVGGKTYKEGSSNIYGESSSSKSTTPTTPTKTTSGSESVKALQRQLNAKGANLKVDGIAGPLTKAAQVKYANAIPTGTPGKPLAGGGTTISRAPVKQSIFANPFAKGSGNFFKNVLGGLGIVAEGTNKVFKDAINTTKDNVAANVLNSIGRSALPGTAYAESTQLPGEEAAQLNNPSYLDTFSGDPINSITGGGNIANAEMGYGTTAPADAYSGLTAGQFMDQAPTPSNPTGSRSGGTTMSSLEEPIDPVLPPGEIAPVAGDMGSGAGATGIGLSPAQQNGINQALMGMKDNPDLNNPFKSDPKGEFQNTTILTYADNLAKNFTSPQQATDWFNSQEGQGSAYVQKGGTLADLTSRVKPITTNVNGIQPAQTTPEFLAKAQASIEGERKIMNDMIAQEANFTQQQKDILFGKKDANGNDILLGVAEQQKKENEERIAYYDRLEARFDKNEKEKARLAIDKARAEFEMKDAEVEIARVNAKNNLTEFLAKIGALRTDGNALLGIEKLEQAYQAQRQQLRQNFLFAEREIRQAAEERMFNLETDLEDKKFKLSQDLSKTEREVMMEGMKLDYDFNKTLNTLKLKWSDSIKTEREKAAQKAETAAAFNNAQWLSLVGQGIDPSMIPGMLDSKGKVIANEKNAQIIQGTYTEPVTLMQGPDGIQYNVPESQVQAFIKDGGRKL